MQMHQSNAKKSPSITPSKLITFSVLLVFLLAIYGAIMNGKYITDLLVENPTEPIASGDFPQKIIWSFDADETIATTPVTDGKRIFIRTEKSVYALDINGKTLWRTNSTAISNKFTESIPTLEPQIFGLYLIVPETGSRISIYSVDTGELIWGSNQPEDSNTHIESIVVNQEIIYVARWNWKLTAYNLQTGEIIWEKYIASRSHPYIASDRNSVYLGQEQLIQSFEARTGINQWELDFGGYSGPMLLDKNVLYVSDEEHSRVVAIDINSHKTLWDSNYPQIEPFEFNCIVVSEDVLYLAAQQLVAISKINGKSIWTSQETGRLECPRIYSNSIFVRNTEKILFKLNAQSGQETGQLTVQVNTSMKHEPDRGPLIFENLLIVPFGDNRVFAYQLNQ